MSSPAAAPPTPEPTKTPEAQATLALPNGFGVISSTMLLIPGLILLAFHLGAGYLSYQKYGNLGWAFLDFVFAYFYYPYYSFFLAKEAAPSPSILPAMVGGKKGLGGLMKAFEKMMK
jgi:hypothetical protein